MIDKLQPELFDWLLWRNGSPSDIFKETQWYKNIYEKRDLIIKYAIGYCDGFRLLCRPKLNHKAVMFFIENRLFWFHLTDKEFKEVFYEA